MGDMHTSPDTRKTFSVFICVGICVAFFQYVSFYVLFQEFKNTYLVSSGISFCLTVIVSYFLQRYVTFVTVRKREHTLHNGLRFLFFTLNSFFGLILNGLIMFIGVDVFQNSAYITQVFSMGGLAFYNFFMYRLLFT